MTLTRVCVSLLVLALGGSVLSIRGVDPNDAHLYSAHNGQFKCLSSAQVIPYSAVNDDYCDCEDGTDEPGTSACSSHFHTPQFYCQNAGYFPSKVHLSRVNDGICEEECCDGSDEDVGVCPNTCAERGEQHRNAVARSEQVRDRALVTKQQYIAAAQRELKRLEGVIEEKRVAVDRAAHKEKIAGDEVQRLETLSKDALSKKMASPLYKHLLDTRKAVEKLRSEKEELHGEVRHLVDILASLKSSYNPNYQDMGVLAAVREYDAYVGAHEQEKKVDKVDADHLSKLQNEDLVALIVSLDESAEATPKKDDIDAMLFNIEGYLPPSVADTYRSLKQTLVDWLVRLSIIPPPSMQQEGTYIQKARKEHKKLDDALQKARNGLAKANAEYVELEGGVRWGRQGEWNALNKECVTQDVAEYTYELCFFDRVMQRQQDRKSGGTSLGRFASWNENAEAGSDDFYSTQSYTKGQRCWNGPERSTEVEIICGEHNALVEVEEQEKCAYKFLATSPAACHDSSTAQSVHIHDEL